MPNKVESGKSSRRDFIKKGAVAAVGAVLATLPAKAFAGKKAKTDGRRLAMVIDRHRCVGCGACIIACKNENNIQQGHTWSSKKSTTTGKFPKVKYDYLPTLCNHCQKAPCVPVCPTGARHKAEGDITAQDADKCIGCKKCMKACPYEGVIYYNDGKTHKFWRKNDSLIAGCTRTSQEVSRKVKGKVIPYYNPDRERYKTGSGLREDGIVEKCTFCDHRLKQGKAPYCTVRCPAKARIFGDLNDPNSQVSKLLNKYSSIRLKEELGTEPKVFYIREFNPIAKKA